MGEGDMDAISQLLAMGQSLWYDNIQRRLLKNGELARLITSGIVRGVTSNPSIFQHAIAKSDDYDSALQAMACSGWTAEEIFYQLAVEDICAAADLFLPLYQESQRGDGYVSLEVNPLLAHDSERTITEAQRLWKRVNRPNLMIKIPATREGLTAIRQTIAAGINVNVTLIFSLQRYAQVMDAYMDGLSARLRAGLPIEHIASVASFFVSRVDTKVDAILQGITQAKDAQSQLASTLPGKAAVANSHLAYLLFKKTFTSERFLQLRLQGAQVQRPLWASTSTKNPTYRDVKYVEELEAPQTVNTVPPPTLQAFAEHGKVKPANIDEQESLHIISNLESLGISIEAVSVELEIEGVKAFADSYKALLQTIEERRFAYLCEIQPLDEAVIERVHDLDVNYASQRIFAEDATFWTHDPDGQQEIRSRLGWVKSPETSLSLLPDLKQISMECQHSGYTHALLLGMGGSSLAPEVLAYTFGVREANGIVGLDLSILDSTHPDQVRAAARRSPIEKTLYIVSSKSGGTSEVKALLDYFWERAYRKLGDPAADHFIAISDAGTSLEKLALERKFRKVFRADGMVGGRYSALTAFGLVPAALLGLDIERILANARDMMMECGANQPAGRNPGLILGAFLGEACLRGRNKLTIIADPEWTSFGAWLEQLIAESSGKQGLGIVPVDNEPLIAANKYGNDRLFVYLRKNGDHDSLMNQLKFANQPVMTLVIPEEYALAGEFYRWEIATAVACAILGINGFDQPDVQDTKTRTLQKIHILQTTGTLDEGKPIWTGQGGKVFGVKFAGFERAQNLKEVVTLFLGTVKPNDYVAINAYLTRNTRTLARLQKLRKSILNKTKAATTLGYGPRFLHSTGQIHKGGANNGVYLQITADPIQDLNIPGENLTFGQLIRAQALGDLEALQARNRRVMRIHLDGMNPDELV
jgi:transaldolase/glucose-6-phosphate isomerase